jgi:hypothetical protein
MKKIMGCFLRSISDFEYKRVLFFFGIVLSLYLITGCLLGTIQESQARTPSVIIKNK